MRLVYAGLVSAWMCVAFGIANLQAAEPSADAFADDNFLVLSAECGNVYVDTRSIADCNEKQQQKADRWIGAIIESYTRLNAAMAKELNGKGRLNVPSPQIWLEQSQAEFERLRRSSGELVKNTGYLGTLNPLIAQRAMFQLTIERARFLLRACASSKGRDLKDTVDLTVTGWC